MKTSKKNLVLTAAFAGLLSGTAARVNAAPAHAGQLAEPLEAKKHKHGCKGQNSCKGQGGCASGDNGCAGKNSCKGKGGCATEMMKPQKQKKK